MDNKRMDTLPLGEDGPFEHLRDEMGFGGGTFPARYAQIFWNKERGPEGRRASSVCVCFVPRGTDFFDSNDADFQELCRSAFSDNGNSVAEWSGSMQEVAGLFGSISDLGFRSHAEFCRAIGEFSRLSEAQWARDMIAQMRGSFPREED